MKTGCENRVVNNHVTSLFQKIPVYMRISTVIEASPPFTFTYPLTTGVVWVPQMTSQPVSSIFLCSPLPSGTWRTPGLSILWCCLPISFSVCLAFFHLSLCLARWFWPDLMNGRHVHTTSVCISLTRSGDLRVVRLPAGSWQRLHGLRMSCAVSCGSTSFPWLVFFFAALLWGSMIHKHTGMWIWQGSASVVTLNREKCSCRSVPNFVSAAVICAILESISGLELSSDTTEPSYLKLVAVSSFCPSTLISLLMPGLLCTDLHADWSYSCWKMPPATFDDSIISRRA